MEAFKLARMVHCTRGLMVTGLLLAASNMLAAPVRLLKAPLHVVGNARLVHVHAEGVTAGEVLARVGGASGLEVRAMGPGATLPVWVHADGVDPRLLMDRVAASVGLVVTEEQFAGARVLVVAGVQDTADRAWQRRMLQLSLVPTSIKLIPTTAPEELGALVRAHVMGPRGRVAPVAPRNLLVMEDVRERLQLAEKLAMLLSPNANAGPIILAPLPTQSVPQAPTCKAGAVLPAWRALDVASGAARGEPVGQVLVAVASLQSKALVVGCGGNAPAYVSFGRGTVMEELAHTHGLWMSKEGADHADKPMLERALGPSSVPMAVDAGLEGALRNVVWQARSPEVGPSMLLFPARKPDQYLAALKDLNLGVVSVLPTMGWVVVVTPRDDEAKYADRLLRQLVPRADAWPDTRLVPAEEVAPAGPQ